MREKEMVGDAPSLAFGVTFPLRFNCSHRGAAHTAGTNEIETKVSESFLAVGTK